MKAVKALKVTGIVLGFLSLPYLWVYGWAFQVLFGWAGVYITVLQGILFDIVISLGFPLLVAAHTQYTFEQTHKACDQLSKEGYSVGIRLAWYGAPWLALGVGWLWVKVLG